MRGNPHILVVSRFFTPFFSFLLLLVSLRFSSLTRSFSPYKPFLSKYRNPTCDPARLPASQQPSTTSILPHRSPSSSQVFLSFYNCYSCFWMFWMFYGWMDGLELCFISTLDLMRGLTHTPPRTRPSGISYMHQYNTIMIKASTCNNLISVHLYVYNDKFFTSKSFSPTYSFDCSLSFIFSFSLLSFFPLQDSASYAPSPGYCIVLETTKRTLPDDLFPVK